MLKVELITGSSLYSPIVANMLSNLARVGGSIKFSISEALTLRFSCHIGFSYTLDGAISNTEST